MLHMWVYVPATVCWWIYLCACDCLPEEKGVGQCSQMMSGTYHFISIRHTTTVLTLFELITAFTTVDHSIFIEHLKKFGWHLWHCVGLILIASPNFCGVSQGSILAPPFFSIYMLHLGNAICRHDIRLLFFMQMTHRCISISTSPVTYFPHPNTDKSKVMKISPDTQNHLSPQLGSFSASLTVSYRNFGITFDNNLCRFSKIQTFLSPKNLEMITYAFIKSHLEYCHSLYSF